MLIVFDPRHPRGFHPLAGGYERELLDLLPDVHRTLAQRVHQALRDEMPVAFFGEQMSPFSIPASVLALAIALFVIAFAIGFSPTMATLVVACLVVSFVLLAPSIVLGYAVKAAERDDAERGL